MERHLLAYSGNTFTQYRVYIEIRSLFHMNPKVRSFFLSLTPEAIQVIKLRQFEVLRLTVLRDLHCNLQQLPLIAMQNTVALSSG